MIAYYKNDEFKLEEIPEAVPNCWINSVTPNNEEVALIRELGIPADFLTYALDVDERPRIEEEDDGTILIVVRVPIHEGNQADIPYTTIPLSIILAEKYMVTICSQQLDTIKAFASGKVSKVSTTKRYRFTLQLLMELTKTYLNDVRAINHEVDLLEDQLYDSMQNTELISLFKYAKSFVYFTQGLKQNELTLVRMSRLQAFKRFEEDADLLDDVITENTQALDMTNISSSILSGMSDAFASIISNNLNVVMKFLASVTIVMSIPNIITGFFGMNVAFPIWLSTHPLAWFLLLIIMLLATLGAIFLFYKRNWF